LDNKIINAEIYFQLFLKVGYFQP